MISLKSLVRDCTLAIGEKERKRYSYAVQYLCVWSSFAIGIHWCDRMIRIPLHSPHFLTLFVYWIFDKFRFFTKISFLLSPVMVNKAYNCSRLTIQMIVYVLTCQLLTVNLPSNNPTMLFCKLFCSLHNNFSIVLNKIVKSFIKSTTGNCIEL